MSKAYIEELIPKAITLLANEKKFADGSIDSVYQGYISSFGVGIVQVGLLPTLAYFESESKNDSGERKIISKLVKDTLGITNDSQGITNDSLLAYAINNNNQETIDSIKDASIALKLSMRLFKLEKGA